MNSEQVAIAAEEPELLRRARRGDADAFGTLVAHYSAALFRVVRRMAADTPEAEAIVQEAFLRTWRAVRAGRVGSERPFFPYLVTVALNVGRDRWRKERRLDFSELEPLEEQLPDPQSGPERLLEESEARQRLAQAVAELPPPYRAVIALRYDAGLSYDEIATALDLPLNTVRTHLHRAKAQLRLALQDMLETDAR